MSQGNYSCLETADVHAVANYMKRVLRQMYEPLIPHAQLVQFAALSACASESEMIDRIRGIVDQMPDLYKNTLHFLMEFFNEVSSHESENRMSPYNLAVCIGPNIFRSKQEDLQMADQNNSYREVMIKMIESPSLVFKANNDVY